MTASALPPLYADDAGQAFDAARPTLLMLHGVGNDHSVWRDVAAAVAARGWNTLAVDLPGHGRSAGVPPASVQEAAHALWQWFGQTIDPQRRLGRLALAGHSFGSLIALEMAALASDRGEPRVRDLILAGSASPMRVAPALQQAAAQQPESAMQMIEAFSRRRDAAAGSLPSDALLGALMRRVQHAPGPVNRLAVGLQACDAYDGANAALARWNGRTLFIVGEHDRMTPPAAAQALASHARDPAQVHWAHVDAGHAMLWDAAGAVSAAVLDFLHAPASAA